MTDERDTEVTIEAGGRKVHTTLRALAGGQLGKPQLGDTEPTGYILSDEVKGIALAVAGTEPRFAHITDDLRVGYALRWGVKPEGKGGIHVLAKAVKAPELWSDLGEYDVVLWANQQAWQHLTAGQRAALMAHELCHIGVTDDGRVQLLEHDIEEFAWVARRFGQWHSGLEFFAEQLGLGLAEKAKRP